MAERIYSTRRRISIMPRLAAYHEEQEEEEEEEDSAEIDSELLKRLQQLHRAEHGSTGDEEDEEEHKEEVKDTARGAAKLGAPAGVRETPAIVPAPTPGAPTGRDHTTTDLTRSQTFDDGEGEDLDEVFKSGTCPSTSAATPTDHAPLAPPVTSKQSPQASRELGIVEVHSPMYPEIHYSITPPPHTPATPHPPPTSPPPPQAPPRRPKHSRGRLSTTVKIDSDACLDSNKGGSDKSDVKETSPKSSNQRPSTLIPSGGDQANKPFRINVPLSKIREENLAKKRSLTKQSTMPELAETVESDTPTAITPASRAERPTEVMNHHGGCPSPGVATRDGASPMTAATAAANSAFPSLPDDTLKQLGLFRQKGDSLHLGEQFTDQEIEEKFASLALAFKTDKLTLEKRIDLHERARDIAEQNVNREIDGLKEAMKTLSPFCTDAASRDIYTKVQHHVEVLEQSTSRVSSRAEVHGAVQQELRMSKAIEVMVNHVENLKRLYDKEHQELEETKKLLTENKVIGQNADGDGLQKRSYSLAGGGGLKLGGRRRASVAAFPRKLSMLGAGSSNAAPDHPMDPKTRFQTLIADTAMKTSVVEQLRRSVSIDHQPVRPTTLIDLKNNTGISKPQDKTISATSTTDKTTEKGGKASLDSNSNIDQEAVFQKGYEEGLRAKVGAELTDLRHQQRAFYDNLEKLIDENEVTDEEEQKLGPSWVEVVWQLWPGWSNSGKKLRLAMAGFIFMLAFLSLLMTLIPVGHASERHFVPFSWTSIDEFLKAYGQLRHFQGEPGYRRGPPV